MSEAMRVRTDDRASLNALIDDDAARQLVQEASPSAFEAASRYWRTPIEQTHLTPRMTELILLAIHGAASALNAEPISRHVRRALEEGASPGDIVDVMVTIIGQANHSLYAAVPILEEELKAVGGILTVGDDNGEALAEAKARFIEARGFWNPGREIIARLMPEYFLALTGIATDTWINGTLTTKERELVLIAINSTVTHSYEPGLRAHIRLALAHGATQDEILNAIQLAGLMGLEGFVVAARALTAGDSHLG